MQVFYIGQEFYYIHTRTGKKVYVRLRKVDGDTLYFEDAQARWFSCKKYHVNQKIFINVQKSTLSTNGNLDEDLGKYTTKRPAKRFDGPAPGTEDIVLPNYRGSKYAGTHRSGSGRINKRKKRR